MFGLVVVAFVCGVVAGLAQGFPVPDAYCTNIACDNLVWPNPPTDSAGNPLPAGASCTMSNTVKQICVETPSINCAGTANIPCGCNGYYVVMNPDGSTTYYGCYQPITRC